MLLYLVGYMGTGKTTIGQTIAGRLGYSFIDLDTLIEEKYKLTIVSFFKKFDEEVFRKVESETLKDTALTTDAVIATGGGTPCFYNNMEIINDNGISIYLRNSVETLYRRLVASKKKRPLLVGKSSPAILDLVKDQLAFREPFYLRSKIIVDCDFLNMNELINSILNFTGNKKTGF
jgi:shikimate kinase